MDIKLPTGRDKLCLFNTHAGRSWSMSHLVFLMKRQIESLTQSVFRVTSLVDAHSQVKQLHKYENTVVVSMGNAGMSRYNMPLYLVLGLLVNNWLVR